MSAAVTRVKFYKNESLILSLISACVLLTGAVTVLGVLFAQSRLGAERLFRLDGHVTLLVGLTLIYLSTLLRRGKHMAWLIALPLYAYIVIRNLRRFSADLSSSMHNTLFITLNLIVPLVALAGLIAGHHYFRVRSQNDNFRGAFGKAALVLLVAFFYGVIGFQLLDEHDFHQEFSWVTGAHYTVDQLNITTNSQLHPYTRRAKLFLGSLATISAGSLFYVGVSLFAPIRFRLSDQPHSREALKQLLQKYPASSEDFFKLWPHDKAYFFSTTGHSALAYRVKNGVALVVGDVVGARVDFIKLIPEFMEVCYVNDWLPAFIHTEQKYNSLYKKMGFSIQKIGEEAVIDIPEFQTKVASNKYFRNIKNRFVRENYSCQIFNPPHDNKLLHQLRYISNQWLEAPGRSERTFMMGYFDENYLQQCTLLVAFDAHGQPQAFINQIPSFDKQEANFDFLRSAKDALGNINDFMMLNFIDYSAGQGYKRLNLGLSPLTGLKRTDVVDTEITALDNALQFVYTAGGRFYSFAGLKRFKDKYEPNWQNRYIVYKGGWPGFGRVMNALVRAMKV